MKRRACLNKKTPITNDQAKLLLPLGGVSKKITVGSNEGGEYSVYQSDRYGFNNPDSEWDKKEIKFILVGSSIVHGACVNENDTIGGNLRLITDIKKGVLNVKKHFR